jgi:hypothetical protein
MIVALASVLAVVARPSAAQARDDAPRAFLKRVAATRGEDAAGIVIEAAGGPSYNVKEKFMPEPMGRALVIMFDSCLVGRGVPRRQELSDGRVRAILVKSSRRRTVVVVELDAESDYALSEERDPLRLKISVRQRPAAPGAPAVAASAAGDGDVFGGEKLFQFSGFFRQETAYNTAGRNGFTKVKNTLSLASTGRITPWLSYRVNGRGYYDGVFALTHRYPHALAEDQRAEDELKEAYIDLSAGELDLRLGRQKIVWGEAVGSFVADVVNPKDFREFILPDFDDIRIPQWAADAEFTHADSHVELIYLPLAGIDRLPLFGSEFPIALPAPPGAAIVVDGTKTPPAHLNNGEWGGRLSQVVAGWDVSGFFLRTWDQLPTPFRTLSATPFGVVERIEPEQTRLSQAGGSFSKDFGPAVLKGEGTYSRNRLLPVIDPASPSGVVPKNTVDSMLGLDFTPFDQLNMNLQFLQRFVASYEDDLFGEERARLQGSLWAKAELWDSHLEPEVFVIGNLRHSDWMIRPKISYKTGGHWLVSSGVDLFEGSLTGTFGQYHRSARSYSEVKFYF